MHFIWFPFIAFLALAGRALSFNITLGAMVLQSDQILNIPQGSVPPPCLTNCTNTQSKITGCNSNAACLCQADIVAELQVCQQCMFTQLIEKNQKPLDMRVGSTPLMGAYAATCKSDVNVTLQAAQTALGVPPSWDGPFVAILPVGGAAVAVIAGGFLGLSALLLLSNMA